jgi:hypothetical protein
MNEYIENSISYSAYIGLIDRLLEEGKTTGPNQSDALLNYARLNRQRMSRIEKTTAIDESLLAAARATRKKMIWLIITEGWCGDAAQSVPVIERIAALSEFIETRYVLRDENPELMERFLTSGARSIPKLIALDAGTLEVLWSWGPRPRALTDYFNGLKAAGVEKTQISERLQRWYNEDRTRSIQSEFEGFLTTGCGVRTATESK